VHPVVIRKVLISLCAGVAAGFVMNQFARTVSRLTGGREGQAAAPGSHRVGRGAQPPQATSHAEQDAAVRAGTSVYKAISGHHPPHDQQRRLGSAAHYAFSASLGLMYGLLQDRAPWIGAGRGSLYGAAVWIVADEGIVPALGLSRGPRSLGRSLLLYGLAGHLVYGVALDIAYRKLQS
jgi:hypothetical protein